jgi:putative transposase
MAETKTDALVAFDAFVETWGVKYDKAVKCLIKDRDALLTFYEFPAEHWKHLPTTNVVERLLRPSATARCAPRDVSRTRLRSR